MSNQIVISLLGGFHVTCDEKNMDGIMKKSRKGMALMQFLILQHGETVPVYRLIDALWADENSSNPESALKTLISRLRVILTSISPSLASCIVTERNGYRWECQPGVSVDLYDFEALEKKLYSCTELTDENIEDFRKVIHLYTGNLLAGSDQ